jgi:hypothetical protein
MTIPAAVQVVAQLAEMDLRTRPTMEIQALAEANPLPDVQQDMAQE